MSRQYARSPERLARFLGLGRTKMEVEILKERSSTGWVQWLRDDNRSFAAHKIIEIATALSS